jgi:SOS-response transcriptional repressor LexA
MTDAGIMDGGYAIICRAEKPENGEIMLVLYANESTLKKVRIRKKEVYLCREDGSGRETKVDSEGYGFRGGWRVCCGNQKTDKIPESQWPKPTV